jgi:hypothetical protein
MTLAEHLNAATPEAPLLDTSFVARQTLKTLTATTQLGIIGSANAQSSKIGQAQLPAIKPGTNISLAPLKHQSSSIYESTP